MNILLLSVGTRNKIVQYFKEEFKGFGKVIATDMSIYAPAIYEADKYYIVPSIFDESYMNKISEICQKEQISGVLSLIDPELSILAKYEKEFFKIGVKVIGSAYDICELALDKYEMFSWLDANNYRTAMSYKELSAFKTDFERKIINFPVIVKPVKGSASLSVLKVDDMKHLEYIFSKHDDLLIQEFLAGEEIGVDAYIDMISHDLVSIFFKRKIKMRAGETDKSVSFFDAELFDLIKRFVSQCGFVGQIDIDVFRVNDKYYISEVNPRFGGGYPHAFECGVNHISLIKNNLLNRVNEPNIGNYKPNVYMMKYNEVFLFER
ncbi:ATP-grasp domain-containing protein [Aerococcaceae bacterium zg-ZJ1578]|uniref:ATP-grasp domain-containing protein n=1 Tax=Aerococcaceae bacterium zg-252 TaxID=2796928 RepID=UPI001A34DAFD|nr:ATP-grasp domain-containing protein [Aerococcaceae bacterium zg-1578]